MSIFIYVFFCVFGRFFLQRLVPFFKRFFCLHKFPTPFLDLWNKIPTPSSKTHIFLCCCWFFSKFFSGKKKKWTSIHVHFLFCEFQISAFKSLNNTVKSISLFLFILTIKNETLIM